MKLEWQLPGCRKDSQSITREWSPTGQVLIEGVRVREVRNVLKANGALTELYRRDWALDSLPVEQVFHVVLNPGAVSAWHAHGLTTDRLFATAGSLLVVLYDGRQDSPSHGTINEFRCGQGRPMLVLVPPGVWHGVANIGAGPAALVNLVDRAYSYEDPDHWRIPADSPEIPYSFGGRPVADALD